MLVKRSWLLIGIALILSGALAFSACSPQAGLSEDEMQKLAEEKAKHFFDREMTTQRLDIPLLNEFLELHETYRIRGYSGSYPYRMTRVIAVGRDGEVFVLAEDFNQMIEREQIEIDQAETALKLAKGYILIGDDENQKIITTFLQNSNDIPWEQQPDYAKDPAEYADVVSPPEVAVKNGTYNVKIYTWILVGGEINKWLFEIAKDGQLSHEKEEIANYVGDCGRSLGL